MHGNSELFYLFKTVRMNTNNRDPAHLSMDSSRTVNILRLPGTAMKCLIALPSNQMLFDAVLKAFSMVPLHMITHKYSFKERYSLPQHILCRRRYLQSALLFELWKTCKII